MAYQCCREVFPETQPGEWEVKATDAPATAGYCCMDLVHNSTALDFSFVPATERPDAFGPFIRVTNSYNTLRALAFDIGFYRKVCSNGLILPGSLIRFSFTHLRRDIGVAIRFEIASERLAKLKASFGEYLGALHKCAIPRLNFDALVRGVLRLRQPQPLEPETPEADDWQSLVAHLDELSDRYASELGETAYAVFSAVTEFASHPPANRCVHRDRHSLQRLAGSWLNSFSRECRDPSFSLPAYLARLNNPNAEAAVEK
jgi:hypothetical protein